jgi:hypothetical protein
MKKFHIFFLIYINKKKNMKNIKNYLNFLNEELSPNKYLYVSNRLDDKVHKNRIDKLKSKFLEGVLKFENIDIVDIEQKVLYKNCRVIDIVTDHYSNIENSVIIFRSELGNKVIWKTLYKNDGMVLSYHIDKPKNLYFTNRYDANRFVKYLKSILLDNIKYDSIEKYSPSSNYYYISDDISDYEIK